MVDHTQTEVKIDVRHSSVNRIMSQLLNVKIVAITFTILVFFVLVFVTWTATYIFPIFFYKLKYHIRNLLQFFKRVAAPQNLKDVSESGRKLLL